MTISRLVLGLLGALAVWPAACAAQQTATPPPAIRTLDKALATVVWNETARGPLLIVAPERTRVAGTTTLPGPPPGRGYTLSAIAPAFGRKLVPLATLTVLAPTEMVVINTMPDAPDLLDGLPRDVKMRRLMALLSPAQWKLLGSARGLGASDLASESRALFLSLLPDPFRVQRWAVGKDGTMTKRLAQTDLAGGARAGVRVRVRRSLDLLTLVPDQPRRVGIAQPYFDPAGGETLRLDDEPEYDRSDTFGVVLRKRVPNRLKPGDLSLDALSAEVPLAGAATVNDLITRVGKATGLELWADRRVGDLPVHVRGTSAQAGDVLKALCLAVTGTFRRVEGRARADDERPFLDLSLLGETTTVVAARHRASPAFLRAVEIEEQSGPLPRGFAAYLLPADYLSPVGAASARARRRVIEIANLAGLAGLVLREPQPPGYAGAREQGLFGNGDVSLTEPEQMGYTPALRLTFLRRERVDPLDLIPPDLHVGADLRVPFFLDDNARGGGSVYDGTNTPAPGFAETSAAWNAFRRETSRRFLAGLHGAIRAQRPGLPLFVEALPDGERIHERVREAWYGSWDKADAPPQRGARDQAKQVLVSLALSEAATPGDEIRFCLYLRTAAHSFLWNAREKKPDNLVVDLSALSASKAAALLETLAPVTDPGELRDRP